MDPATPYAQRLQAWHAFGLGFTPFAHHYLGHLLRFLFLRLLRCFTSPGCRPRKGRMDCSMQVSPFRYPRIKGCLLLPAAFRSWLRLSSASGAKAFPACPLYLNLINPLLTFFIKKGCHGALKNLCLNNTMVEMIGFEPTTSCVQGRRSPTELHPQRVF